MQNLLSLTLVRDQRYHGSPQPQYDLLRTGQFRKQLSHFWILALRRGSDAESNFMAGIVYATVPNGHRFGAMMYDESNGFLSMVVQSKH